MIWIAIRIALISELFASAHGKKKSKSESRSFALVGAHLRFPNLGVRTTICGLPVTMGVKTCKDYCTELRLSGKKQIEIPDIRIVDQGNSLVQ